MGEKVGKAKESRRKDKLIPVPRRLQTILPVLIRLQNLYELPPNGVLREIGHLLDRDYWKQLTPQELHLLRGYLSEWGLDDYTKT